MRRQEVVVPAEDGLADDHETPGMRCRRGASWSRPGGRRCRRRGCRSTRADERRFVPPVHVDISCGWQSRTTCRNPRVTHDYGPYTWILTCYAETTGNIKRLTSLPVHVDISDRTRRVDSSYVAMVETCAKPTSDPCEIPRYCRGMVTGPRGPNRVPGPTHMTTSDTAVATLERWMAASGVAGGDSLVRRG